MTNYRYSPEVMDELRHVLRLAIGVRGARIDAGTLREDFGGVDVHFTINQTCPVQIRSRFNRPAGSADRDVTFRTTERGMLDRGTYAPLTLFAWFQGSRIVAGKLIDSYGMRDNLAQPLADRPVIRNHDGTGFVAVTIAELHDARALLRQGDAHEWAAARLGGNQDVQRIIDRHQQAAS